MKKLIAAALLLSSSAIAPIVHSEDGVLEFWKCALKEGKTAADAKAVNAKWLKLQNGANPGANIRSWGLTSVVGETGSFGYMDAFPSLEAWAKSRATIATPAGAAIEAELNAVADCSMNRLFEATEH
ncbi:MAG: hypothetical protein R3E82_08700 [Pseudomonadales bacterium]|nr:hypothetical protein [Pseudomonadales bacterium]